MKFFRQSSTSKNENALLKFTVSGSDPDGDSIIYSATTLPQGATFDPATQSLSWTPNYYQAGQYTVTFTVSDGTLSDSKTVTITVNNVNGPPLFDPIGDKTAIRGELLTFTAKAVDPDGDKVRYNVINKPRGAQFNRSSGLFKWKPAVHHVGNFVVTFVVKDTKGHKDTQTIIITVSNTPPVLNPIGDKTIRAGQLLSFTLTASDADPIDADKLRYCAKNLPKGATLNKTTGLFSWKPILTQRSSYKVRFIVKDRVGASDDETSSIAVR